MASLAQKRHVFFPRKGSVYSRYHFESTAKHAFDISTTSIHRSCVYSHMTLRIQAIYKSNKQNIEISASTPPDVSFHRSKNCLHQVLLTTLPHQPKNYSICSIHDLRLSVTASTRYAQKPVPGMLTTNVRRSTYMCENSYSRPIKNSEYGLIYGYAQKKRHIEL